MTRTAFLVDPDAGTREALAVALRERGVRVVAAEDLDQAIQQSKRERPDVWLVAHSLAPVIQARRLASPRWVWPLAPHYTLVDRTSPDRVDPNVLIRDDPDTIVQSILALPVGLVAEPTGRNALHGDLIHNRAAALLERFGTERCTGVLTVTTTLGTGEIRLVAGVIVDAVYRRFEGAKALFRLLTESEGHYLFTTGAPCQLRRIRQSTENLVAETTKYLQQTTRLLDELSASEDALQAVSATEQALPPLERRLLDALSSPRDIADLLDSHPEDDGLLLAAVRSLVDRGLVRRISRAALGVELADSDSMSALAQSVGRLRRPGFLGNVRLVLVSDPMRLAAARHALGRIANSVISTDATLPPPAPYPLGTLHLVDGVDLDLVGLPNLHPYSPLWGLTLPGTGAVVLLGVEAPQMLAEACSFADVPLLDSESLVGPLEEADPRQMATLLRNALESASGR